MAGDTFVKLKRVILGCLLALLVVGCVVFFVKQIGDGALFSAEKSEESPEDRYSFVQPDDLILYLTEADFHTDDTDSRTEITALWGENVTEDIKLVNEDNEVVLAIPNDRSGEYVGNIYIDSEKERVMKLRLVSGEHESSTNKVYIHPSITEEMTDRLFSLGEDLKEYAMGIDVGRRSSSEGINDVVKFLQNDERVFSIFPEDDEIV
ncbi:MAG: hypothetical protein IJ744_05110 [Lachnospiraceae bacterium]|nr:hypothetical protein [Lachnospiraceae bacterium]